MVAFAKVNGSAKKGELEYFKFKDGTNVFRMFGGILARYVYWVPTRDGSGSVPIECLSFDREEERFTNLERDVVSEHFPDINCGWAYMALCLDPVDGKVKALGLKKKMFEQIILASEDLGDPTDLTDGWAVAVNRKKTGPKAFNVEYTVEVLKCQKNKVPLTAEEIVIVEASKTIDEYFPRQTVEDQLAFLKRSILPEEEEGNVDEEAAAELAALDDDIPM